MSRRILVSVVLAVVTALAATKAHAQAAEQPTATVSMYRIAPGQHIAFLEWMATQEAAAQEAGGAATQWYVHMDGDGWDYVGITPDNSPEVERRIEEVSRQRGLKTGFQGGLEFRRYIAYHTDTQAWGPTTVQQILEAARQ